ncbi:uncharacterized protein LOC114760913 [Neltuma alba]|uniref:uncharacterized protein LOC114760913 n=1 Tax=Neltuma alba TaxID=207710 RepID=UPI0010A3479D|nr:uncharacterized protein LOC114760913 [Prosopis alba]
MVKGLRQELREKVAPRQLEKFNQAVEACQITESSLNHQALVRPAPRPEGPATRDGPEVTSFGGNRKSKPGHYIRECPFNMDGSRPQAQGRVFALTKEEADKSPEMIQGMIQVNNYLVHAMFDSGASHSFVSYECAKRIGLAVNTLLYDLCVATPTGTKVYTFDVCLNCIVQYAHCCTTLDLICMPFHEIDAILGLNCLSTHNILLDCKNRTLIFPPHELTPHTEVKINLIMRAQAGDYLKHGCQGYVVFFSVHAEVEEGVTEIPVVCDFLEVFPTEISGLPPE